MALKTSLAALVLVTATVSAETPKPPGKMVDVGGHRLHVNCSGQGHPTVVVENGLGDFSFDWVLVQKRVSGFTRICTYDRAGYAWSDPGPKPRTFAQINWELRDALAKLGEQGPYVLVGHSYGGPVVRNFAIAYPKDAAAMVQVDAAFEGMRVGIGGGKTTRLGDDAKGRTIPAPQSEMKASDKSTIPAAAAPQDRQQLDPLYRALPEADQKRQLWAQSLPEIQDTERSQTDWSGEYFAQWMKRSQTGTLGSIPLVVLTRAEGGYHRDQDVSAVQLEKERMEGQAMLVTLSTSGKQVIVKSGHNMELEAPREVAAAIRTVVEAVRKSSRFERRKKGRPKYSGRPQSSRF